MATPTIRWLLAADRRAPVPHTLRTGHNRRRIQTEGRYDPQSARIHLLLFDLPATSRGKVTADFAGGSTSSDCGLVLPRGAERRLRLAETGRRLLGFAADPLGKYWFGGNMPCDTARPSGRYGETGDGEGLGERCPENCGADGEDRGRGPRAREGRRKTGVSGGPPRGGGPGEAREGATRTSGEGAAGAAAGRRAVRCPVSWNGCCATGRARRRRKFPVTPPTRSSARSSWRRSASNCTTAGSGAGTFRTKGVGRSRRHRVKPGSRIRVRNRT